MISEGKVMSTVVPIISSDVTSIQNEGVLVFTRLDPITNNTTVDAKPDFYDGARLEEIDTQVQEEVGPYIIPTGHATAPVAPNFFMESKAPKGGADVAKRQACYDGAIGARECTVCSRTAKASQFTMAMLTRLLHLIIQGLVHSKCTPLILLKGNTASLLSTT